MKSMVEVQVLSVLLDKTNNTPVLLLKEKDGNRILPIWIGFFEAESIITVLKGIFLPRPMTHDLCSDTICVLGGKLIAVHIYSLEMGTFYSRLVIDQNGNLINIDSRPSDSISVALRQSSPIFVSEQIMEEAAISDIKGSFSSQLEDILVNLPDDAFGKYKM